MVLVKCNAWQLILCTGQCWSTAWHGVGQMQCTATDSMHCTVFGQLHEQTCQLRKEHRSRLLSATPIGNPCQKPSDKRSSSSIPLALAEIERRCESTAQHGSGALHCGVLVVCIVGCWSAFLQGTGLLHCILLASCTERC